MKIRKVLKTSLFICFGLFFLFSVIDVQLSIEIVLFLVITLVVVKLYELFMIYFGSSNRILLGKIELFRSKIWDYLISILAIVLLYLTIRYGYLIEFKPNTFVNFFFDSTANHFAYYIISLIYLISFIINDKRIFYFTKQGLVSKANYFEDYLWEDFKAYTLIEEQSLIRFTNKNDKFLFVKYEESYFQENKTEILNVLNKNIPYV
ncbi:hypothetical protein [uncultured Tenacibaculum sp.]|uniref:hypothetical protein n=1 Tax=uncultured Tenacibaculum sp. TaxID=174713 RepID=UPI0026133E0C|nr:hypothetical protein [uncultured Tenacibaculum sp.]